MSEYNLHTLQNGIRIAHKLVTHTKIVHCGIMLNIGSRDEKPHQTGLAHFWEHMAFKGTHKRKSFHILNRLESLGGELNAFTTKEKICFYASVLDQHTQKAIELLTDITFNSIFPEKQLDLERQVILEEMSLYADSPEDAIQDDFDQLIFEGHALGENILGNPEKLSGYKREDLLSFIDQNLSTDQIVLSIVGNITFEKAIKLAEKFLGQIPVKKVTRERISPIIKPPKHIKKIKDISQAHVAIGRNSFAFDDPKRLPFFTLINLLGGGSMNSRFNMSLREKHGLVYNIEASLSSFSDSGYFGIYYATEPQNLKKAERLVYKELKKLRETPLGNSQLRSLKDQLKGQLAMSEEGNQGYMLMMAKSILDLGRVEALQNIFEELEAVSSIQLQELAIEMFKPEDLSTVLFKTK